MYFIISIVENSNQLKLTIAGLLVSILILNTPFRNIERLAAPVHE